MEPVRRSAVLHDFCMIIPYSLVVIVGSLLSIALGTGQRGLLFALAGALQLFLTIQSLKRWQKRKNHLDFTAASAGILPL